jgi:putative ABC transport system permease protein
LLDTLFREIRLAVRSLARSPGFTVVAVITLALGIGANTALFTVLKSVVLDSLPFENPDRLAVVLHVVETSGEDATAFSPADYLDLRDQSRTFETLAGHRTRNVTMTGRGRPERLRGESVSSGFFQVFGVEPELGRFFLPEDESGSPETRSMVLSHAAWMGRFGGDPGIVGSHLTLDGEPHVVLGVAPPQFRYSDESEIWIRAYRADVPEPPMDVGEDLASIRSMGYFSVVGRLAAGATFDQAQAELDLIAARLDEAVPEGRERTLLKVVPLREDLVGQVRPALLLLLGAVGTVLLIACANVANLLLARSTGRLREAAIRSAVGASRWQIVRQMLVESTVLGAIAGAAGLLVGVWAVDALVALAPEDRGAVRASSGVADLEARSPAGAEGIEPIRDRRQGEPAPAGGHRGHGGGAGSRPAVRGLSLREEPGEADVCGARLPAGEPPHDEDGSPLEPLRRRRPDEVLRQGADGGRRGAPRSLFRGHGPHPAAGRQRGGPDIAHRGPRF